MLIELRARDLGILTDASVTLGPGLNVITGETGAGKTLLMTTLALLTGARADSKLVAAGSDAALIEAIWDGDDGELIVSRRIGADGRSRCWLDGRTVPVSVLAEVCGAMVEVHGQGAGFALASPRVQLDALDAFAGTAELLDRYRAQLGSLRQARAELEEIESSERERIREIEFLSFQVDEIDRAGLAPDEEESIASRLGRLEHAEQLASDGARALALLGSDGAAGLLSEAAKLLTDSAALDPGLAELAGRVSTLAAETDEAGRDVRDWAEGLDPDPAGLEELRDRSAAIGALKRKHGSTVAEVLASAEAARARLAILEGAADHAVELRSKIEELSATVDNLADELSARRRIEAVTMSDLVGAELPALALPSARFEVVVEPGDELTDRGRDRVEFTFTSDSRRPSGPLGKVASGGELSRAMIAVTLALASTQGAPVLVFDEADAGVGGAAALELARRLSRLARTHQVLVVSHLPQIAAFADRHIVVSKESGQVEVSTVDAEGRLAELSRMLAGLGSSDTARAHAAELLELAGAESVARA